MDIGDYYTIPRVCSCGSSRVRIVGVIGLEIVYECARCKDPASCMTDTFLNLIGFHAPAITKKEPKCNCDIVQLWNTGQHEKGCCDE